VEYLTARQANARLHHSDRGSQYSSDSSSG
jgi:transposase InsO family protein